jgi:Holliday junction resolvasome RuvABC endonuclease subunit
MAYLYGLEDARAMGALVMKMVERGATVEYGAKALNETAAGKGENHRVEVKVLVNKGIIGA